MANITIPFLDRKLSSARLNYFRRKTVNLIMLGMTGLMTISAIVPLIWIIIYVIIKGGRNINLDFLINLPSPLGMKGGGVWHAIQGTILLSVLASILCIPLGLLAAFYIARFPNTILGISVRFGTDVLSGIPSIVVGLFVYALAVSEKGLGLGYSALAGGISLAIIMLPSIIRTTEEMIKLVPSSFREASLGLGASEWKTALQVILPAASNGIITGIILGLARASGETAPLLFTALGNERFDIARTIRNGINQGQNPLQIVWSILTNPVDSLPLTLYKYSQLPNPERISQAWAAALVLISLVLVVNIFARLFISIRSSQLRG